MARAQLVCVLAIRPLCTSGHENREGELPPRPATAMPRAPTVRWDTTGVGARNAAVNRAERRGRAPAMPLQHFPSGFKSHAYKKMCICLACVHE